MNVKFKAQDISDFTIYNDEQKLLDVDYVTFYKKDGEVYIYIKRKDGCIYNDPINKVNGFQLEFNIIRNTVFEPDPVIYKF